MENDVDIDRAWNDFRAILADRLCVPPERVVRDATFVGDLGADSLAMTELLVELEDKFKLTISQDNAADLGTVGDAFDFVSARVRTTAA